MHVKNKTERAKTGESNIRILGIGLELASNANGGGTERDI